MAECHASCILYKDWKAEENAFHEKLDAERKARQTIEEYTRDSQTRAIRTAFNKRRK